MQQIVIPPNIIYRFGAYSSDGPDPTLTCPNGFDLTGFNSTAWLVLKPVTVQYVLGCLSSHVLADTSVCADI